MKIEKIRIKNFRSYKEEKIIELHEGLNVFVGENNVGKSNIFISLKKLKMFLENEGNSYPKDAQTQHAIFLKSDWNLARNEEYMEIEVIILLNENEKALLINTLMKGVALATEEKLILNIELGNKISIIFRNKWETNLLFPIIKIDEFYFYHQSFSTNPDVFKANNYYSVEFRDVIEFFSEENKSFINIVKNILKDKKNGRIELKDSEFYKTVARIFFKNFKIFEDIRQKPEGEEKKVEESLDGRDAAAVLFNLKNGQSELRKKYKMIKTEFHNYFPQLNLEVIKQYGSLDIMISSQDSDYEHSLSQVGTGILEFVIVLTNLIGSKNNVFVFEDPELHLHPSTQRSLSKLIESHSKDNQVIIITHSPTFVNYINVMRNTIVRYKEGQTAITQLKKNTFTEQELSKLSKELNGEKKEIFFSRAVLLVEGDTELGALPIFAEKIGKNFDIYNIFVCSVGGKKSFSLYQKLLENFEIPYAILCDEDALELKNVDEYKNKLMLNPNFEEYLINAGFNEIIDKAKREIGRSKPRIGRYIAEKIPLKMVPEKFVDVINLVVNLSK